MADEYKIQLLKKAVRNLKAAVDVLSEREREQLKDLIIKGQISSEEELRAYLARMISVRTHRREQDRMRQEERLRLQKKAAEEESGRSDPDEEGGIEESSSGPPGPPASQDRDAHFDEPAKITGKVIDARSRKGVPYVRVRVTGTNYNAETETTGVFIWEELPRTRQVNFEFTHKDYKNLLVQYRSTVDNEQHLVVKIVPRELKDKKKKHGGFH